MDKEAAVGHLIGGPFPPFSFTFPCPLRLISSERRTLSLSTRVLFKQANNCYDSILSSWVGVGVSRDGQEA